ncbi:MmgE/PrpD family protein [Celeribacter sp. ULVN23_4]
MTLSPTISPRSGVPLPGASLAGGSLEIRLSHLVGLPVGESERRAATDAICDTLAVALAGAADPRSDQLMSTLATAREPAPGLSFVLGTDHWLSTSDAALYFGFSAHLLDYDDDETELAMAHLSAPSLAATLAVVNRFGHTADEALLIDAYVTGCKAMLLLGAAWNPALHTAGWHPTSVLGVFGATLAAARYMGLDQAQSLSAIRLAASLASGGRGAFGGMGKPLQVGQSAASGVRCAELAQAGWPGSSKAFDGLATALFSQGAVTADADVSEFPPEGFVTKLYPSCTATHAAIYATLTLCAGVSEHDLPQRITCALDPCALAILQSSLPRSGDEGRFSLAYCLATAAVTGRVGLAAFEAKAFQDGAPADPRVRDMISRIDIAEAHDLPFGPSGIATGAHVTVFAGDHETHSMTTEAAPGSLSLPVTAGDLSDKWCDCLSRYMAARYGVLTNTDIAADLLPMLRNAMTPGGLKALQRRLTETTSIQGKQECKTP